MPGIFYCSRCNYATEDHKESVTHEFTNAGHLMKVELI